MKEWPRIGAIIDVQAYKYDGTLYRQLNGLKVLESSPEKIVLYSYKTKVAELYGPEWMIREPQLWFFPVNEFHNTTALLRETGTWYYTNIASPPIFEDNTLKFIDLDLDIKMYPGKKIKVVDQNEYEKHKIEYGYPRELVEQVDVAVLKSMEKNKAKHDYFNSDVIKTYIHQLKDAKLLKMNFRTKG